MDLKCKTVLKEKKSLEYLKNQEKKIESMKKNVESLRLQIQDSKNLSIKDKQNVLRLLVDEIIIQTAKLTFDTAFRVMIQIQMKLIHYVVTVILAFRPV